MSLSKKGKKKLAKELAGFIPFAGMLIFINLFSSPGYLWCLWAIVPWGFSILATALKHMVDDDDHEDQDDYLDLEMPKRNVEYSGKNYRDSELV